MNENKQILLMNALHRLESAERDVQDRLREPSLVPTHEIADQRVDGHSVIPGQGDSL